MLKSLPKVLFFSILLFIPGISAMADVSFEFETLPISIDIGLKTQVFVDVTNFGSGQNAMGPRTDIHFQRNRLSLTGMYNDMFGMKFQTCGNLGTTHMPVGYLPATPNDWNDRDIRIIDAYIIGNFHEMFNLKIGLTKNPLTRANLDDCFAPLSVDRSNYVYTPFGGSPTKFSRDLGAVAWGDIWRFKYFVGIFEGREGQFSWTNPNPTATSTGQGMFLAGTFQSTPEVKSNLMYAGRLMFNFLDKEEGAGFEGTYLGEKKILTIGFGVNYEQDVAYKYVSGSGLNGGVTYPGSSDTVDYLALAADIMFELPTPAGTFTAQGQFLYIDMQDAYLYNMNFADRNTVIAGFNGQKIGVVSKIAYLLPVSIGEDGEGKFQIYGIFEWWKFAHVFGVNQQQLYQYGGGLNIYIIGQNVRASLEYLRTDFMELTYLMGSTAGNANKIAGYDQFRCMFQFVL